jgi:hypothetical protein
MSTLTMTTTLSATIGPTLRASKRLAPSSRSVRPTLMGKQAPCPKFTVRATDADGQFDDDDVGFSTESLAVPLDHVGFLTDEVVR